MSYASQRPEPTTNARRLKTAMRMAARVLEPGSPFEAVLAIACRVGVMAIIVAVVGKGMS